MNRIEQYFSMQAGKVVMRDRQKFDDCIRALADGTYLVAIDKAYSSRSNSQNAYYWSVIVKAFRTGFQDTWGEVVSIEEAHGTLKERFNFTEKVNEHTGEIVRIPRSTASLTTKEFTDYMEHCRAFIQEWFNIEIPDPNETL